LRPGQRDAATDEDATDVVYLDPTSGGRRGSSPTENALVRRPHPGSACGERSMTSSGPLHQGRGQAPGPSSSGFRPGRAADNNLSTLDANLTCNSLPGDATLRHPDGCTERPRDEPGCVWLTPRSRSPWSVRATRRAPPAPARPPPAGQGRRGGARSTPPTTTAQPSHRRTARRRAIHGAVRTEDRHVTPTDKRHAPATCSASTASNFLAQRPDHRLGDGRDLGPTAVVSDSAARGQPWPWPPIAPPGAGTSR